jgi:hypothetical protein
VKLSLEYRHPPRHPRTLSRAEFHRIARVPGHFCSVSNKGGNSGRQTSTLLGQEAPAGRRKPAVDVLSNSVDESVPLYGTRRTAPAGAEAMVTANAAAQPGPGWKALSRAVGSARRRRRQIRRSQSTAADIGSITASNKGRWKGKPTAAFDIDSRLNRGKVRSRFNEPPPQQWLWRGAPPEIHLLGCLTAVAYGSFDEALKILQDVALTAALQLPRIDVLLALFAGLVGSNCGRQPHILSSGPRNDCS